MTAPRLKLYPSAPLQNYYIKQRLDLKLNVVISFITSKIYIKEMNTHFRDKNRKSKKDYEN